jgi:hypothetical protein
MISETKNNIYKILLVKYSKKANINLNEISAEIQSTLVYVAEELFADLDDNMDNEIEETLALSK